MLKNQQLSFVFIAKLYVLIAFCSAPILIFSQVNPPIQTQGRIWKFQIIDSDFNAIEMAEVRCKFNDSLLGKSGKNGMLEFKLISYDSIYILKKGFKKSTFNINDLDKIELPNTDVKRLILRPEQVLLDDVQVKGKKDSKILRKGSNSKDGALALGIVPTLEFGRLMHFKKSRLFSMNANICSNAPDSGTFVLRIYLQNDDGDSLIFKDRFSFKGLDGKCNLNYEFEEKLKIEGNLLFTLELIEPTVIKDTSVYFSTSTLTGATHYRYPDEKDWNKFAIVDVAFQVEYKERNF